MSDTELPAADAEGEAPRRMRRPQAAAYLGVSAGFLEKAAARGNGPPYVSISSRLVVYERDALDRWLAARRVGSAAEAAELARHRPKADQSRAT